MRCARRKLQQRFGPEYDRAVAEQPNRGAAEQELRGREQRHAELELRDLSPQDQQRYVAQWQRIQGEFVDDPHASTRAADALITDVMRDRGYPTGDFEERVDTLSVEHARTLDHYRNAHDIAAADGRGEASTEQLRQALVHYRALAGDLLGSGAEPTGAPHGQCQRSGRRSTMSFTEEPAPAQSQSGQTQTIDAVADRADRTATAETPERDATAESPERDATAKTPDRAPSDGQLRPGDTADDPVAALWGADLVEHFRGRWQELQLAVRRRPARRNPAGGTAGRRGRRIADRRAHHSEAVAGRLAAPGTRRHRGTAQRVAALPRFPRSTARDVGRACRYDEIPMSCPVDEVGRRCGSSRSCSLSGS